MKALYSLLGAALLWVAGEDITGSSQLHTWETGAGVGVGLCAEQQGAP